MTRSDLTSGYADRLLRILNRDAGASLIIVCYIGLAVFLAVVSKPAPISDEAAYAKTALIFADSNRVELSKVTEPIALVPIAAAAILTKLIGFSLTGMRFLVLGSSLLCALAFYHLLRQLEFQTSIATVGALALVGHPTYFVQSMLFMTEVPFVCLLIVTVFCAWRGLTEDRSGWLACAGACSFLACMTRQPGIFIPVSIGAYLVLARRAVPFRSWMLLVGVPIVADIIGLMWFYVHGGGIAHRIANIPGVELFLEISFYLAVYSGLLCLPLWWGLRRGESDSALHRMGLTLRSYLFWLSTLCVGLALISWKGGALIPFAGNILAPLADNHTGIAGEIYTYVVQQELPYDLPAAGLKIIFAVSVLSAAALLSVLYHAGIAPLLRRLNATVIFAGAAAALIASIILVYLGPDFALRTAKRVYDLKPHAHPFADQIPRILRLQRTAFVQLGVMAVGLFAIGFVISGRDGTAANNRVVISPSPLASRRPLGLGILYAVCIGQAIFDIFAVSVTQGFVFRRYALTFAPGILVLILDRLKEIDLKSRAVLATVMVLALYGALQTRAMMDFAEAKWEGALDLMQNGAAPSNIDAGLTFTNWYLNEPLSERAANYTRQFLVVANPIPGYRELRRTPVTTALSGTLYVYELERADADRR